MDVCVNVCMYQVCVCMCGIYVFVCTCLWVRAVHAYLYALHPKHQVLIAVWDWACPQRKD